MTLQEYLMSKDGKPKKEALCDECHELLGGNRVTRHRHNKCYLRWYYREYPEKRILKQEYYEKYSIRKRLVQKEKKGL